MLKRFGSLPDSDLKLPLTPRPFWKAVKRIDQGIISSGLSRFCGEVIVAYTK
jgi:hypothetical protein